jgi:hypothetical protein
VIALEVVGGLRESDLPDQLKNQVNVGVDGLVHKMAPLSKTKEKYLKFLRIVL